MGNGSQVAMYTTTYGYLGYFYQVAQLQGSTAILGLPSADGRGPMLQSYISLAVSAQSKNADACGEFVKMLMTDDVQKELGAGGNFVLLKEAFRAGAKDAVDYLNGPGGEIYTNKFNSPAFTPLPKTKQNLMKNHTAKPTTTMNPRPRPILADFFMVL